jgi:hypothetical protein
MAAMFGIAYAPERAWPNLLLNGFYFASLGVSAIFFLSAQRLTGARWSASLRRIPEAFALVMPLAAALMLLVLFGMPTLYPWSHAGSFAGAPEIAGRMRYLKVPWMCVRVTIALFLWILFAWLFRRASLEQDKHPRKSLLFHHRLTRYAAFFIPIFAITFSWSVFDWLLSLDSQWFSTMFAVYVFAGTFVQGIAAVTLATIMLKERGVLRGAVNEHQLHDLGKMLFAFSTFWAYIWTCQYLLIWYGNIPDEVTHYLKRTNGGWVFLFALNLILNWIVPFCLLLSVRAKRSRPVLKTVCILLLVGHWLDLYLLIMPSVWSQPKFGPFEVAIAAGYVALLYLLFVRNLSRAPLVPVHDPVLASERPALVHRGVRIRTRLSGVEQ